MKLTLKDEEFLERLRRLFDEHELSIESKRDGVTRLVLRKNYGARVETHFGMTRQGVRWRFHRLFNDIYVNAYIAILWVESNFGTHLRNDAMEIARERVEHYRKVAQGASLSVPPRKLRR